MTTAAPERPRGRGRHRDDGADPRIARRRGEVTRARASRRTRRLLVLAVAVSTLALSWAVLHSPLADIDEIHVHGATHTGDQAVVDASGLTVGGPLVGLDADAVAGVEHLSWVRDAQVHRNLGEATVDITVVEREPEVVLAAPDGGFVLMDHDGVAVDTVPERPVSDVDGLQVGMIELTGVDVPPIGESAGNAVRGALDVVAALPAGLGTRVDAVRVDGEELTLVLRPTGTAQLGRAEQIDAKIRSLLGVLAQVDLTGLCSIDVRAPGSAVVDRSQPCT